MKILIVDDQPHVCTGLSLFLKNAIEKGEIPECKVDVAYNSESALILVQESREPYDIVILDIQLPPFEKKGIYSGEELGVHIKKLNDSSKIIVITYLSDNYRLFNIFKRLNPHAFIIKSDLDEKDFISAIQCTLSDEPYFSTVLKKLIRKQFANETLITFEERKFLHLLDKGILSKDIPEHLPWSKSKVERKKRELRQKLQVDRKGLSALISKAREKGFL